MSLTSGSIYHNEFCSLCSCWRAVGSAASPKGKRFFRDCRERVQKVWRRQLRRSLLFQWENPSFYFTFYDNIYHCILSLCTANLRCINFLFTCRLTATISSCSNTSGFRPVAAWLHNPPLFSYIHFNVIPLLFFLSKIWAAVHFSELAALTFPFHCHPSVTDPA